MKVSVTGATGFLGQCFVRLLRARNDEVLALTRRPSSELRAMGCDLVEVDITDRSAVREAVRHSDAVVHIAGDFRIGIRPHQRETMFRTNVSGTSAVIEGALEAGVPRIAYVSTINAVGNTHEMTVDETFLRAPDEPFMTAYEQSKTQAHEFVVAAQRQGAPVIIVMPGAIMGPGDRSLVGLQLRQALDGTLPFMAMGGCGLNLVHVDDVATGLLQALDDGTLGQSYILGGENVRLNDALRTAAEVGGRTLPKREVPTWVLKGAARFGPSWAPRMGLPPNMREVIAASDRTTYWVHAGKAERDLGYQYRSLRALCESLLGSAVR